MIISLLERQEENSERKNLERYLSEKDLALEVVEKELGSNNLHLFFESMSKMRRTFDIAERVARTDKITSQLQNLGMQVMTERRDVDYVIKDSKIIYAKVLGEYVKKTYNKRVREIEKIRKGH